MIPYKALFNLVYIIELPFLPFMVNFEYLEPLISFMNSQSFPLMATIIVSLTSVWIKSLGISTTPTSLFSTLYRVEVTKILSVFHVGDPTFDLSVKTLCLSPPATSLSLIVPLLFFYRNI